MNAQPSPSQPEADPSSTDCAHYWVGATPSENGAVICTCRLCGVTTVRTGEAKPRTYPRRT